eukprot:scaffold42639_cov37-Attheya_sp.AAC.2
MAKTKQAPESASSSTTTTTLKPNKKRRTNNDNKKKEETATQKETSTSSSSSGSASCQKGSGGLDAIESLFQTAKQEKKELQQEQEEEEQQQKKKTQKSKLKTNVKGDRRDLPSQKGTWVNDGLGGKFDNEGFTGRKESGVKIFKAHTFNKQGFGQTPQCPFDCDCCFI